MKNLLLIFLVLLSTTLSAVEYGYFSSSPGDTETNRVAVGINQILEFPSVSHSDYEIDSEDYLVVSYPESEIEVKKGTSHWTFSGRKIYGPCEIYIRKVSHNNSRFFPYKLYEKKNFNTQENLLVIPANASDENTELIAQISSDGLTWTNILAGNLNQEDYPQFCRLVISGLDSETISANASFGFGLSTPTTETTYRKILNGNASAGHLVTLQEGQLFVPLYPMFGGGEVKVYANISTELNNVFVCGFNNEPVEAFPGPAILSHGGNNSSNSAVLNYSIVEKIEQNALSGGIVTIPAGNSVFEIAIQYSDDLTNWQPMSLGAQPSPANGIRFYRLSAAAE